MDTSLYLSKEYGFGSVVFEKDLHWMKQVIDADTRRRKEEERLRKIKENQHQ